MYHYHHPSRKYHPYDLTKYMASRITSRISETYLQSLHHKYSEPQDVHFYALRDDERGDQPPCGMIAIEEPILNADL